MNETSAALGNGADTVTAGGDSLLGLAMLGKTALALAIIVALIFATAALFRRLSGHANRQGGRLRLIGSTPVGTKERVVIVEVEGTWLVLGVGGGQVNKLHELAAPANSTTDAQPTGAGFREGDSFATRFAKALKHNARPGRRSGP